MKTNKNFIRITTEHNENIIINVNYIVQITSTTNVDYCEITMIVHGGRIETYKAYGSFPYFMNLLGC